MDDPRDPTPIDDLAEAWLDTMLELAPELHIHLGRPGRESDYGDYSPDGIAAQADAARSMLERVRSATPDDQTDVITRAELIRTLELELEQIEAGFWQRDLNVIASPGQSFRDIFDVMSTDTDDDWSHVAKRLHNLPAAMSGYLDSLRIGIAAGNVPAIRQVREVAAQARKQTGAQSFFHTLAASAEVPDSLRSDLEAGAAAAAEAY
nr:hypothetical protein [Aeromicrobium sp.]